MKRLSMAFLTMAMLAFSTQSCFADEVGFDKYFSFSTEVSKPTTKKFPKLKEWRADEQELVRRLLTQAQKLSPKLIERVCTLTPIKLLRADRYYVQADRVWVNLPHTATAVTDPGRIAFCDEFFGETDEHRLLNVLLHELTHDVDIMRIVSFTPEWRKYFNEHFRVEARSHKLGEVDRSKIYARNLGEALADTYPRYLLGDKIPDKEYFETQIVPLLVEPPSASKKEALRHFVAAEISYRTGDYVSATQQIQQTIRLNSKAIVPQNMLCGILCVQRHYNQALALSRKCMRLMDEAQLPSNEPERISLYTNRAMLLIQVSRDFQEAKRLIELALEERPADNFLIRLFRYCNAEIDKQQK